MAKEESQSSESKNKPQPAEHRYPNVNSSSRYLIFGLAGLVILVIVFWAGMATENHKRQQVVTPLGPTGVRMFGGGRFYGGRDYFNNQNGTAVSGNVTAVNGSDFTVNQNGTSKTVKTDSNTRFIGVGIDGLKAGDQVTAAGTANSDGSIQAINVAVNSSSSSSSI